MQTTYEERLNRFVAIILIAVLTLADIIAIGAHFASLALDMVATTNSNVEFEAYFKDENGEKVSEQEINLNAEKANMYVDISILREGYFNGKISLQDSNFSIIGVTENAYVQGFEESEVKLNQIRSGENVTVEMQVKPKTSNTMNPEMLSKETKVNLEGKYTSSKGEETVSGKTTVKAKFVTAKDAKTNVEAEILTNKIFEIDGENKRVLQVLVKSQIKNNVYPVLKSNIALNFPSGVESIEATTRSTTATNSRITFGEDNLIKDLQKSKLEIKLENNKDENGNISFEQNAKDEFVITCVYPEDKTFKNMKELENALGENEVIKEDDKKEAQIQISQEITTYDNKVLNANIEANLENDKDGIVNYELTQEESEFYKGKIYSGEERDYNINVIANVNSTKVERGINFTLEETKYLQGEIKKTSKITYKTITIKKDEITKALGEEGYITVKDENNTVIANITKETVANESILIENDNITIKIPENTYKLKIESSKAVQTGKIDFKITKTITEKEYTRDEIKTLTGVENRVTVNEEIISKNINLKETTTEANFEINAQSLKAGENKNIQIKATLLASDESQDLYKNPTLKITFPSKATNVEAPYKTLYANGLEVKNAILKEEAGRKVLFVEFEGEQKEYFGKAIDGTVLLINANITMDKLMTNGEDKITLEYTNENANNYAVQNPSNPTSGTITRTLTTVQAESFIVTNKIAELDVDTTGKEEDKQVEIKSGEGTTNATVEIGGINNEGETLQNVKILGRFPTKNTTNTMDITLTSGIELTTSNENVKVYYSTKEDATEDLNATENGWTEDSTLEGKTSYLIVIPSLEDKASFGARYGISISKSSEEEKTASEKFEVKYTKPNDSSITTVESTRVVLKKSGEIQLKVTVFGKSNNDRIQVGKNYSTYISIYNASSTKKENISVNISKNDLLSINQNYTPELKSENELFINEIESGETKNIELNIKCTEKKEKNSFVEIYVQTEINNIVYKSNVMRLEIEDTSTDIQISSLVPESSINNIVKEGDIINYNIKIKNTGKDNIEKLNINSVLSNYLEFKDLECKDKEIQAEVKEGQGENNKIINIGSILKPEEELELIISTKVIKGIYQENTEIKSMFYIYKGEYCITQKGIGEIYISSQEKDSDASISEENKEENKINSDKDINEDINIIKTDYENKAEEIKNKFYIKGNVWLDKSEIGKREFNSEGLEGIGVKLLNVDTGRLIRNIEGNDLEVKTNREGMYKFVDIQEGKYIILFEYDEGKYAATEYHKEGVSDSNNSDAILKNIEIEGKNVYIAATDILNVNGNIENIDLGLIEIKKASLEISKTVSKIEIDENGELKSYEFNEVTLAKVEISPKKLNDSKVTIEYTIKIKNKGNNSGYLKEIVDYMPMDLEFDSNKNSKWINKEGKLYCMELEGKEIKPGEEKKIKLILTKSMNDSNTGLTSNLVKIIIDDNESEEKEYNYESKADIIIGIKTGNIVSTIIVVIYMASLLIIIIYKLKYKVEHNKKYK